MVSPMVLMNCGISAYAQDASGGEVTILEPIAVTATEVAPGGVQIGEEELERINPTNIKDVFTNESSVNVSGGSDVARKVYVNGFEDTNLNVKIDGARQVNSAFHHLGTAIIDPGLLKSVRVETGVGPTDVGPGSLGGSIAYETKDARDLLDGDQQWGGYTSLQYDTNGNAHTEVLTLAGRHENLEWMAYRSQEGGNIYEDGDGNDVAGTKPDMENTIAKFALNGREGGRLEIQGNYLKDEAVRPNRANFGALVNGSPPTFQEFDRKTLTVSYVDEAPTKNFNPEAVFSFNQSSLFIHDLQFGSNLRDLKSETTSYNGKLANTFTTGLGIAENGSVSTGVDFFHDTGHGDISDSFASNVSLVNEETSLNGGVFVQTRLNMSKAFRLNVGARYDQQRFEGIDGTTINTGGVSGSANVEYDFLPELTGYAGAASTFGGIPLGESAIYNFASQWNYDGLSASRSKSYKAGFKGENGRFFGDFHGYYTEIDDSHDRGNATRNSTRDIKSLGWNLSGKFQEENWYLRASFSDNRLRSNGLPLSSGSASYHGLQMGTQATLDGAYDWYDHGIRAGGSIEYSFTDNTYDTVTLKQYKVVNVFAEYLPDAVDGLTLRLDIRNLLDETYVDRATSGVDNSSAVPYNEPGRSVLATAKYVF
ncbi:TonB-dependent receptor domain-containing protein [Aestuariispira insulae]|nr:TonB-dependent receptor [Aestuariispira insulae]